MKSNDECVHRFTTDYSMRLAKESIALYQKAIGLFLLYSDKSFDEIKPKDIRCWINHLETKYSASTIRIKLQGVKLFYKYCLEEELIMNNPSATVPYPKIVEKSPYYLENEQLAELRKIVEGRLQERAVIELLYTTGVRISEMAALKLEDIIWSDRIINVRKGKGKKDRIVLFTRPCEECLRAYLKERKDNLPYVFLNVARTGPIKKRYVQKNFEGYRKELGFHLSTHTLRHTFAAHLARKDMPLACIQSLLGHVRQQDTQMYARLFHHAKKQMYDEWM